MARKWNGTVHKRIIKSICRQWPEAQRGSFHKAIGAILQEVDGIDYERG